MYKKKDNTANKLRSPCSFPNVEKPFHNKYQGYGNN